MSCARWLAWRVGWGLVTARERGRVARKLAEHPIIDDVLRRGEASYSKVRAMQPVATAANEPVILEHARLMTAELVWAMLDHAAKRLARDSRFARIVRRPRFRGIARGRTTT